MDTATVITTVFAGLGVAGLLSQIVRFIIKRIDGSAARESNKNTTLETQRSKAINERDQSDAQARILADYAARSRRQIIELGGTPEDWPDVEHTLTPAQLRKLRTQPKEKRP